MLSDNLSTRSSHVNINEIERGASLIGGGLLMLYAMRRRSLGSMALALLGGELVYRGATGHCHMYQALGFDTAHKGQSQAVSVPYGQGIRVVKAVTIDKTPEELYQFWHHLENLPHFMKHLESVQVLDAKRSHWKAKGPIGLTIEWDAEIINEIENETIAWRSLEGSSVDNAGSVNFKKAPGQRGTEVIVRIEYSPPGGVLGAAFAKIFGEDPGLQIQEDLHRFKQLMELGELPTTAGQPSGRAARAGEPLNVPRKPILMPKKKDVVQQASEESFPASDAPSWAAR